MFCIFKAIRTNSSEHFTLFGHKSQIRKMTVINRQSFMYLSKSCVETVVEVVKEVIGLCIKK